MIAEVDTDNSGTVQFDEFVEMMAKRMQESDPEQEMLDAFKVFDKNGDGHISATELKQVMDSLGEKLSKEEIDEMINDADKDGNGQIEYAEFVRMMMQR